MARTASRRKRPSTVLRAMALPRSLRQGAVGHPLAWAAASTILLMACLADTDNTARGTVVENEIAGRLYVDGGVASGALVRLYTADFAAEYAADPAAGEAAPLRETFADAEGAYRFEGLAKGAYSVVARHGTLIGLRDSTLTGSALAEDTLKPGGYVEAEVALRPGDEPSSVSAQVLGSSFVSRPDAVGSMAMAGMPEGNLRLRIFSSLPGYDTLYATVPVRSGDTTRVGTLVLPTRE